MKTKALGDAKISIKPDNNFPEKNGYFEFTLNLDYVHFHEAPSIGVQLELTWQTIEFEIIDQWVEVVPTDQVAGVAVRYNPVTGRQIPPE